VFAAFLRPDFTFISGDEVEPYFQELQERLDRLLDLLLPAKENINGAFEIYTSHVAHRTNGVMKLLTIVSTVVLPGTLILGFFGTSFEGLPLYDTGDFILMVALIVLSTVGVLWMFRRQRWM
jgi:magnesium transporter